MALPLIVQFINQKTPSFDLPMPSYQDIMGSGNAYNMTLVLPAPFPSVPVVASVDVANNQILMDGPASIQIDFTAFANIPIFKTDCIITANVHAPDGGVAWPDIYPSDLDGNLTAEIIDVVPSPGGGGCILGPPTVSCSLIVGID
jgi:hypothetical protein